MKTHARLGVAVGVTALVLASAANGQVRRPSGAHAFFNFIPFGGSGQVCTQHQVFDAALWSGPMEISALGFAANDSLNGQSYASDIIVKLGYTEKIPGQSPPVGLDSILSNNPSGPMTEVFNASVSTVIVGTGTEDFSFILQFDTPFCYDPAQGNLLVELFSSYISGADLSVSRTAGSAESSRAYNSTRFGDAASPTTATRMDFYEDTCGGGGCGPLDFQHLEFIGTGSQNVGEVVTEDGFQVTKAQGEPFEFAVFGTEEPRYPGSTALYNNTVNGVIKISAIDGSSFDVLSIDFAMLNGAGTVLINLVGNKTGGGQVFQTITHSDSGLPLDLVTYNLTGFTGLDSIEWLQESPFHQFDNVILDCGGGGLTLRLSGTCPGTVTVAWDGATPSSTMGIVYGANQGSTTIPGGPCAGTVLGVQGQVRLVNTVNTGSGSGQVNGRAGSAACGNYLQLVVVDGAPCTTSNVAQIP